jgi:hypothetical protein
MSLQAYALCRDSDNYVINTIIWDSVDASTVDFGEGKTVRLIGNFKVSPGDTFDGVTLTKAVPKPLTAEETNRRTLLDKGAQALASNATYLAIPSPTQAQAGAQVQSLTKQVNALIRLASSLLDTTDGT